MSHNTSNINQSLPLGGRWRGLLSGRRMCFDIIKGICIIAVVLLHSEYDFYESTYLPLWSLLGNSWHVGVFFVVSGFFLKNEYIEKPKSFIFKRVAKLYFKLISCYILFILLHNVFINTGIYSTEILYGGKQMSLFSIADTVKQIAIAMLGGGREPLLSPLWFIYCLCASYVVIAVLRKITCNQNPITSNLQPITNNQQPITSPKSPLTPQGGTLECKNNMGRTIQNSAEKNGESIVFSCKRQEVLIFIILFLGSCMMHMLDIFAGIRIPRYANVFAIALLIYIGFLIRRYDVCQRIGLRWFVVSAIIFYLCTIFCGPNILMTNDYYSVPSMLLCIVSAFFALYYVSVRIENTLIGMSLAFIGRHSFAIMVWHLSAFKLVTLCLNLFGYNIPIHILESYAPSLALLLLYTSVGVLLPALMDRGIEELRS